jgi:hypothetical protein
MLWAGIFPRHHNRAARRPSTPQRALALTRVRRDVNEAMRRHRQVDAGITRMLRVTDIDRQSSRFGATPRLQRLAPLSSDGPFSAAVQT